MTTEQNVYLGEYKGEGIEIQGRVTAKNWEDAEECWYDLFVVPGEFCRIIGILVAEGTA